MDAGTYEQIYSKLSDMHSVSRLSEKYHVSKHTLNVLLTQKIIRETKKNHSRVKVKAPRLLSRWRRGDSFLDISKDLFFPPVMVATILLAEMDFSRAKIRAMMKNPLLADDARLKRELSLVLKHDFVYSPSANREQARRGRLVEDGIGQWLSGLGLSFKTEEDSRREGMQKTPDFLLGKSTTFSGRRVNWVESKATFGDFIEIRSDFRKQVRHYVELFGPGAVIYWYGFLEDADKNDVILLSSSDIKGKK